MLMVIRPGVTPELRAAVRLAMKYGYCTAKSNGVSLRNITNTLITGMFLYIPWK